MEGVHNFPYGIEGESDPYNLLALGVSVLFYIVDLLIRASLHFKAKHFLHFVNHFTIPHFGLIHTHCVDSIDELKHDQDSLTSDTFTL